MLLLHHHLSIGMLLHLLVLHRHILLLNLRRWRWLRHSNCSWSCLFRCSWFPRSFCFCFTLSRCFDLLILFTDRFSKFNDLSIISLILSFNNLLLLLLLHHTSLLRLWLLLRRWWLLLLAPCTIGLRFMSINKPHGVRRNSIWFNHSICSMKRVCSHVVLMRQVSSSWARCWQWNRNTTTPFTDCSQLRIKCTSSSRSYFINNQFYRSGKSIAPFISFSI